LHTSRLDACPYLGGLDASKQQEMQALAARGKRHWALSLILRAHPKGPPRGVPSVHSLRPKASAYCCQCDADDHKWALPSSHHLSTY
jgi:hypothetical protein